MSLCGGSVADRISSGHRMVAGRLLRDGLNLVLEPVQNHRLYYVSLLRKNVIWRAFVIRGSFGGSWGVVLAGRLASLPGWWAWRAWLAAWGGLTGLAGGPGWWAWLAWSACPG